MLVWEGFDGGLWLRVRDMFEILQSEIRVWGLGLTWSVRITITSARPHENLVDSFGAFFVVIVSVFTEDMP